LLFGFYEFPSYSSNQSTSNQSAAHQSTSNSNIQVQLLGVNDFHGQLNKYQRVSGTLAGGAEFLAAYLKKYRQENPNTLLVHAGDMVGGSPPISSQFQDEPTVEFLNLLHFDVGTPGNHELDQGVNEMTRLIYGGFHKKTGNFQGSSTSYTSANIILKQSRTPLLPQYVIKQIDGIQIGFIGVVTAADTNLYVAPEQRKEVEVTDEVSAINQTVQLLKKKGVKAIVVLAHDSASSDQNGKNPRGTLVEMAAKIDPEVDVIFAGHSHEYANTVVAGKLIVQAYSYGIAFSQVNLEIDHQTKDVVKKQARIIITAHDKMTPDKETISLIDKYREKLSSYFNQVIGTMPDEISRNPDINGESSLAKMIGESEREAMGAEMAFVHQGEMRYNLKKGNITIEDLYTDLPFGHSIKKLILTGEQIKLALEQQWRQGQEDDRLQTVGFTYSWDPNAPIGKRIVSVKDRSGQELQPKKEYQVAISDYLAAGGDEFTAFEQGRIQEAGPPVVETLINHIQKNYPAK
jgi:5'-nucleotidase